MELVGVPAGQYTLEVAATASWPDLRAPGCTPAIVGRVACSRSGELDKLALRGEPRLGALVEVVGTFENTGAISTLAVLEADVPTTARAGDAVRGESAGGTPMMTTASQPMPAHRSDGVVYMSKPLERDGVLPGYTYKLRWPASDHAIYVTINDIERDGRRRPFEIFINTRNLEHYAWTVALTRMISAVFRRGGDVTFVAEELKAVFDPQGGQWMNKRYVPSLLAAIGDVIERHMIDIGFLNSQSPGRDVPARELAGAGSGGATEAGGGQRSTGGIDTWRLDTGRTSGPTMLAVGEERRVRFCPRCASPHLDRQEGCLICRDCGFSRCG